MKLNWNKKYTTIAVYACLVILFGVLIANFIIKKDSFESTVALIKGIFSPILFGIIIAYILNPLTKMFEKKVYFKVGAKKNKTALRRALSLISTYVIFLAVITGFLWLLLPNLIESLSDLAKSMVDYVSNDLKNDLRGLIDFNDTLVAKYDELMLDFDVMKNLQELTTNFSEEISELIKSGGALARNIIEVVKNLFLGLFFSIYFLASKELLARQFKRFFAAFFTPKANGRLFHFAGVVNEKFGQFIIGKALDSFIVMCIVYLLCWIFKIPYYPMIALIIGVTDLIPVFGPFLGAIPSAIIILIAGGFWKAVWFALIILIVQQIDGNIIAPLILGDKVGIESVWIMTAVVVMGGLLGIPGMFFGVPIFAVIYTLLGEWIHSRLVAKGLEISDIPEEPAQTETKLFGIKINIPIHEHEREAPDENIYDDSIFITEPDKPAAQPHEAPQEENKTKN